MRMFAALWVCFAAVFAGVGSLAVVCAWIASWAGAIFALLFLVVVVITVVAAVCAWGVGR